MHRKKGAKKESDYKTQDLLIDSDSGSDDELRKTEELQVIRILEQAKQRNLSEKHKKSFYPSIDEEKTRQFYQTSNFNSSKALSSSLKPKFDVSKTQKVGRWNHFTGTYDKYTPNDSKIYKLTKYDPVYLEERNDPYAPIVPDLSSSRKQPKLFFSLKNSNSESQKQAFSEFVGYYKEASSKTPVTVFEYKKKEKPNEEKSLKKLPSSRTEINLIKNSAILIENREALPVEQTKLQFSKHGIRIASILQNLIDVEKTNFEKTKISRFVDEIPKIEMLEWRDIIKELNANKLEILIIDPIRFNVDVVLEFKSDTQEEINSTITHLVENSSFHNEAKYFIVNFNYIVKSKAYVYIGETKSIFMKKFVFSVQNNYKYAKGLKDEKEIILYYELIIGIINQNMREIAINKLSIDEIVELAKEKARFTVKGIDLVSNNLDDWITKKIDNVVSLEMVTRNNGRQNRFNGTFDVKDFYLKTLKRYKKPEELHSKKSLQELPNILETSKEATNLLAYEPISGKSVKRIKLIPNPINVTDLNHSIDDKEKLSVNDQNESTYTAIHKRHPLALDYTSPHNVDVKFRIGNITPFRDTAIRDTVYIDNKSPKQNIMVSGCLTKDKSTYRVQKVFL